MDDAVPSLSTDGVGSRFVSQTEIDSAKARREEQWKAAYARLGQEPPPQPVEDVFDGRSLAEKLAANKAAKQEEWEERMKLANQFRALEEDEVQFLDSIVMEQRRKEKLREEEDSVEVKGFKQAIAARNSISATPPGQPSVTPTQATKPKSVQSSVASKKAGKVTLKGVVVKKRKTSTAAPEADKNAKKDTDTPETKSKERSSEGTNKRQKLSSTEQPDPK